MRPYKSLIQRAEMVDLPQLMKVSAETYAIADRAMIMFFERKGDAFDGIDLIDYTHNPCWNTEPKNEDRMWTDPRDLSQQPCGQCLFCKGVKDVSIEPCPCLATQEDCGKCNDWGFVVVDEGEKKPCPACLGTGFGTDSVLVQGYYLASFYVAFLIKIGAKVSYESDENGFYFNSPDGWGIVMRLQGASR